MTLLKINLDIQELIKQNLKKENNRNDKKNTLIVAEIKNVNKEPAIKFIDKRFANVRD